MKCLAFISVAAIVIACSQPSAPRRIVYVPDVTGSVAPSARAAAIEGIARAGRDLQRGDTLTVIPITSDAAFDAPQRTLRFSMSAERQPYDFDLLQLGEKIKQGLGELLEQTAKDPFQQTDVFGTLRLAAEELGPPDPAVERILIVLSDLIQDEAAFDFTSDKRLSQKATAAELARELGAQSSGQFQDVQVFLGSVPSVDLKGLSRVRRHAIQVFWTELIELQGGSVTWASDGVGQVSRFLVNATQRQLTLSLNADHGHTQ